MKVRKHGSGRARTTRVSFVKWLQPERHTGNAVAAETMAAVAAEKTAAAATAAAWFRQWLRA